MNQKADVLQLPRLNWLASEDELPPGLGWAEVALERSGVPFAPFKAARFSVEPGYASPVDSHAVHEIWIVMAGEGELLYDNQSMRLQAGDVVYYDPPKTHQVRNDGTEALVMYSIWWQNQ